MPYLNCQLGGGNYVDFELPDRPITIGRSPQADLQVADERISRIHCGIRPEKDSFFIKDLGSTNGTWLNDERVQESRLRLGDTIRVGHTVILFDSAPRQQPTAKLPQVIEVELPSRPFEESLHQIVDEATHGTHQPPAPSTQ